MRTDPWLLVPEGVLVSGRKVVLDPEEARHASGSLRLHAGDHVVLTDGAGKLAGAELIRCVRSDVVAVVDEGVTKVQPLPGPTVALGVLHTKAMDWAVQKAVEVGAATFVPLLCDRSQGSHKRALERVDHWRRVARQALKQCRRTWGMVVESPMTIESVVGGRLQPGLVADPEGLTDVSGLEPHRMTLLVGPEGGLTPEEQKALAGANWSTIALGPHILRAETAVVVGAALLTMRMQAERG
ncbi:MAG: 16S rRNA (uracil(1498)-N(3))-methyltransferase [Lentisphaeria bacterium]|nr:16S rRNA (uracil(1498)-N(3))-methyltransferase [Lentisphaeria bacterium]